MSHTPRNDKHEGKKVVVTLPGTVEKVIPAVIPAIGHRRPEMVEIAVEGGEALYREIRVNNALHDEGSHAVSLKLGGEVQLKIEATSEVTLPPKEVKPKEIANPVPAASKKKSS